MTFNDLQATLGALAVTGVDRKYTHPPEVINPADMPMLFPRLPSGTNGLLSVTLDGRLHINMEMVILVRYSGLDLATNRFDQAVDLMDNLNTALVTESEANLGIDRWDIRYAVEFAGGEQVTAIIATIEAS